MQPIGLPLLSDHQAIELQTCLTYDAAEVRPLRHVDLSVEMNLKRLMLLAIVEYMEFRAARETQQESAVISPRCRQDLYTEQATERRSRARIVYDSHWVRRRPSKHALALDHDLDASIKVNLQLVRSEAELEKFFSNKCGQIEIRRKSVHGVFGGRSGTCV